MTKFNPSPREKKHRFHKPSPLLANHISSPRRTDDRGHELTSKAFNLRRYLNSNRAILVLHPQLASLLSHRQKEMTSAQLSILSRPQSNLRVATGFHPHDNHLPLFVGPVARAACVATLTYPALVSHITISLAVRMCGKLPYPPNRAAAKFVPVCHNSKARLIG